MPVNIAIEIHSHTRSLPRKRIIFIPRYVTPHDIILLIDELLEEDEWRKILSTEHSFEDVNEMLIIFTNRLLGALKKHRNSVILEIEDRGQSKQKTIHIPGNFTYAYVLRIVRLIFPRYKHVRGVFTNNGYIELTSE